MDYKIAGVIGIAIFLLFIGGLAESIGALPFVVIVAVVGSMAAYSIYEDMRDNSNSGGR